MKQRVLVGVVGVPVILIALFVLPRIFTPILIAALSVVAAHEIQNAIGMNHPRIQLYTDAIALLIPFWCHFQFQNPGVWAETALLIYALLVFAEAVAAGFRVKLDRVAAGFALVLLISGGLSAVVRIGTMELRSSYVFLPIVLPFVADAAAMLSGMKFGQHKLAPELSPKKTIEGSVGCFIGGILTCLLYGIIVGKITGTEASLLLLVLYGLFGSAIAQVGDLFFSHIKRTRKIKDYGTIFPGHGGVLDRFDSVVFCAPFIELMIYWLPAFRAAGG